jgi:cytochrome c oxidase cbb3-type subunit I/II
VRVHIFASLLFLLVGLVLLLAATASLAWPDAIGSLGFAEYLTYGRAMPAALNALVFGWLTLGLLAAAHHALPRLGGGSTLMPLAAIGSGLLVAAGTAAGVGAILIGESGGGRMLEMPWYADAALLVAFLVAAVVLSTTASRARSDASSVATWYLVAASWWLFLAYAAGAVPGLRGAPAEIQSAFSATALYGMWLASAGVGVGYYLIARLVPDASFHPRLGRIGFWSLGFTWAWTTARTLQYGPMPNWMETIPVLFTAGLIVAVITIVADFAFALRGRWDAVAGSVALRLYAAGVGLFVLVPGHMLLQSFRSSSAVVRFTGWESGFEYLTLLGAFTLWTAAFLVHLAGITSASKGGRVFGPLSVVPVVSGVLFAVATRWVAGLQQGYTWIGGVEAATHDNFGEGFFNTVAPLQGTERLTFIGIAVAAVGLLVLAVGITVGLTRTNRSTLGEGDLDFDWPDTERLGVMRRGAAFVFALTAVAAFALPAIEATEPASVLADASRNPQAGTPEALGRDLYVAEGCWYCHTQQVRAIVTDVGLGAVSTAGDYAYDPAGIFGVARIGPDLMHAGSRDFTGDPIWVVAHLRDPRVERPWSTMPAYDHLSEGELTALASYVAGLE